jgi:uncharacterized membrane protein YebE (DUF533 family)
MDLDMNRVIDLRGAALEKLTRDFNEKVIAPMVAACKAAGMTDEETNLEINRALFDAFKGLHGFPDSHRP